MKKVLFLAIAACAVMSMTSCKNREQAYRAAYERAKAQETVQIPNTTPVQVVEAPTQTVVTTPATPSQQTTTNVADVPVRTIQGPYSVIKGAPLKTFSVVVGSFSLQPNAEGLFSNLQARGLNPSIVKTNETINGISGWYRVVASSYDDKGQAAASRDQLRGTYADAWLLYHK